MSDAMFERLEGLGAIGRGRRSKQAGDGGERERVRRDSFAGPDLPVRFSRISIASNQDSKDPWSQRSDSSGHSGDSSGHVAAPSPLTSSDFRQRADKDRSFTGSAPPGVRPPTKGRTGLFGAPTNNEDEIDHDEPRRDAGSAPVTRPPPLVRARQSPLVVSPALHGPITSEPTLNTRTVTPQCQDPKPTLGFAFTPPPPPPPAPAPAHPPHRSAAPHPHPLHQPLHQPSTSSPHPDPEPQRAPQRKSQRAELRR